MSRASVKALLDQVAQEVGGLDLRAIRELGPIIAEAQRDVQRSLSEWLAMHPDGSARFTAAQFRSVTAQLGVASKEAAIRGSRVPWLARMREDFYGLLRRAGELAGVMAAQHIQLELAQFSTMFGLTPIPVPMASILAKGDRLLVKKFANSAARYSGAVGNDIKRQLAVGVIRGETIDQLTNRLQRLGGPKGFVFTRGRAGSPGARGEYISTGLFARYRNWAERLVRTETIVAYNMQAEASIRETTEETGIELQRRWDAALDRRVCVVCRELDNKVATIGEAFPGGYMSPPAHPNCRCSVVAWHPDWRDLT